MEKIPQNLKRIFDPHYLIFFDEKTQNHNEVEDLRKGKLKVTLKSQSKN
jgi:hypothetical protein